MSDWICGCPRTGWCCRICAICCCCCARICWGLSNIIGGVELELALLTFDELPSIAELMLVLPMTFVAEAPLLLIILLAELFLPFIEFDAIVFRFLAANSNFSAFCQINWQQVNVRNNVSHMKKISFHTCIHSLPRKLRFWGTSEAKYFNTGNLWLTR